VNRSIKLGPPPKESRKSTVKSKRSYNKQNLGEASLKEAMKLANKTIHNQIK
jgi:hypothetical protein